MKPKEITEIINDLKIPTLSLIGLFFYIGSSLIKESEFVSFSGVSGVILLGVGIILGIIIFVDYRYKEQSEHIIDQQHKAIDNLSKLLKTTSETHSKIEKNAQTSIETETEKIGTKNKLEYSVEKNEETSTKA